MKKRNLVFPFLCLVSVSFNMVLINKLHSAHVKIAKNEAENAELKIQVEFEQAKVVQCERQELEKTYAHEAEMREIRNQNDDALKKASVKCPPCPQRESHAVAPLAVVKPDHKKKIQYQLSFEGIRGRVRGELRLDEPIVIQTEAVFNCNQMCSSGLSRCAPKCILTSSFDAVPHVDACTFNSQDSSIGNGKRCLQVGRGQESEATYVTMAKARQNPKIWTTTYRLDADAPAPYYDPTSFDIVPIGVQPIQQRKRAAVAVISNCGAKPRKRVIEKLRKHITVDWFGKCEQRAWPTDGSGKKLRKIDLLQQYAVYLAFENTVTQHYSTEKLYGGLAGGCVTVVFGAPNSKDMAPRGSILHIEKEKDAEEVGKRLKAMLQDPDMKEASRLSTWYRNGTWREDWEERMGFTREHSICRLCDTLRLRVPVATGADDQGFKALKATVSSLHTWEFGRKAVVFDMGMNEWQRDQVRGWADVALIHAYEYHSVPADARTIRQHALLFALDAVGAFLWLEAGTVVEGRMREIDKLIREQGFMFVREDRLVGEEVEATTLLKLGLPEQKRTLPMLSAAVQGYGDLSRDVFRRVLLPATDCMEHADCHADSTPQAILSLVAQTSGLHVTGHASDRLVATDPSHGPRILAIPGVRNPQGTKDFPVTVYYDKVDDPSGEGRSEKPMVHPYHPRFKPDTCVKWKTSDESNRGKVIPRVEYTDGLVAVFDHHLQNKDVRGVDLSVCSTAPKDSAGHLPQNPLFDKIGNATMGSVTVLPGTWLDGKTKQSKGRASLEECAYLCWVDSTCGTFWHNARNGKCFHMPGSPQTTTEKEEKGLTSGTVHRSSDKGSGPAAEELRRRWERVLYASTASVATK